MFASSFLSCSTGMQLAAIDACHEQVGNKQQEQQQKETTTKGNNNNNNNNQQSTVNSPKSWEDCHYYHWRLWTVGSSTSAWSPMLDLVGWGKRWTRWTLIWYNRICLKKPPWRMQKKTSVGEFRWILSLYFFFISLLHVFVYSHIFWNVYTYTCYLQQLLFVHFIHSIMTCHLPIGDPNDEQKHVHEPLGGAKISGYMRSSSKCTLLEV